MSRFPAAGVLIIAAGLLAVLGACSLEYEEPLATEISEDTPDTVFFSFMHTVVQGGAPRFVVGADRAETYGDRKRQYLSQVTFTELANDGSILTEGTADYAEYETDTENFELSGNLRFYSAEEDAWLTADELFWDNDTRVLTSEPVDPVLLERGDGTVIRGRGFVAEMGRSIIRFEDGVSGTLVEDEADE